MKNIIIIRHAKSSWTDFNLTDFERPLDKRGLNDAPEMAKRLRNVGYTPDKLISSSATRALETAAFYSKEFGLPITSVKELYHGMPDNYLDAAMEVDDSVNTLLLFGHNPGITYIANIIQPGCTDNVSTCGMIIAEANIDKWSDLDFRKCNLKHLIYPKTPEF